QAFCARRGASLLSHRPRQTTTFPTSELVWLIVASIPLYDARCSAPFPFFLSSSKPSSSQAPPAHHHHHHSLSLSLSHISITTIIALSCCRYCLSTLSCFADVSAAFLLFVWFLVVLGTLGELAARRLLRLALRLALRRHCLDAVGWGGTVGRGAGAGSQLRGHVGWLGLDLMELLGVLGAALPVDGWMDDLVGWGCGMVDGRQRERRRKRRRRSIRRWTRRTKAAMLALQEWKDSRQTPTVANPPASQKRHQTTAHNSYTSHLPNPPKTPYRADP
ncbi:hypothetical protein IWZ00DRAFT_315202, partial [Phyllosticta capitalensis]